MITDPWLVNVWTYRPLPDFMRLTSVGYERRADPDYHFEGRFRQGNRHAFFQYTFSGRGIFQDALGAHDIGVGKGFLCRAADPNTAYYYPPDETKPWVFLWIAFEGEAALRLADELVTRHGAVSALPPDDQLFMPFLTMRSASGLVPNPGLNGERMPLELDPYSSARLVSDFLLGLGDLNSGSRAEDSHALLAQKAQRLIRDHLGEEMNASQLADALSVSREHLARVFREQTGMSPYAFITRQRLLRACRYLKESALSQKEIAAQLGFPTLENFSRAFKRVMKITPGQYRKHGPMPVE